MMSGYRKGCWFLLVAIPVFSAGWIEAILVNVIGFLEDEVTHAGSGTGMGLATMASSWFRVCVDTLT